MTRTADFIDSYHNGQPQRTYADLRKSTCDHCGFEPGSFACRIRTLHLNTGDAKAARD